MNTRQIADFIRLNAYRLSRPNSCVYRNANNECCVVGLFLTEAELDRIVNAGYNDQPVSKLIEVGMLPDRLMPIRQQLINLQDNFDNIYFDKDSFLYHLEHCIEEYNGATPDEPVSD